MLRLPPFTLHVPDTAAQAASLYAELDHRDALADDASFADKAAYARDFRAMYLAGGTDLLPNLKHKLFNPGHLISLSKLPTRVRDAGDHWVIDAQVTLDTIARHPDLPAVLTQAAGHVAGPQLRRMGTLGGNVMLDTRCLFYNQTALWRQALGHCLKAEGDWCHVIAGPKTCVAVQSSDTVPVLIALGAELELVSPTETRVLPLAKLYRYNGFDPHTLSRGELLTAIRVPKPDAALRGTYRKLRPRGSIDFPRLGLAVTLRMDGQNLADLNVVLGAVGPTPKPVKGLDGFIGAPLSDAAIGAIADKVVKSARPNAAVQGDPAWRRELAGVFARRALESLRD